MLETESTLTPQSPVAAESLCALDSARIHFGHPFHRLELLERALTHSSYVNELTERASKSGEPPLVPVEDNEKLEFLGDAVIGLVIAQVLMEVVPEADEGKLSRLRSFLVSSRVLAEIAAERDIGRFIRLGKGELHSGGTTKTSILAAAIEAVVGAVYLDADFATADRFVRALFLPALDRHLAEATAKRHLDSDPKTHLQERTQAHFRAIPGYRVVETWGPEHQKQFRVELTIQGNVVATGEGRSKKEAEQNAAQKALDTLTF